MDKPMIGIRQADGSFYEIMGDAQTGHKRLVLSAARTDQHGVKIDLYRSTDGSIDPEGSLGSIALDDPEGLGYQDIEFRVDLDAEGQLAASAALPGQPPQTLSVDLTRFRESAETDFAPLPDMSLDPEPMTLDLPDLDIEMEEPRSDADILGDDALASAELDNLDDFTIETGLDEPEEDEPRRSDTDILGDASFESAELDTLDDFSFEEDAEGGTPETRGLDEMTLPETDDFAMPEMDDLGTPAAEASFDLGDLDAGFGEDEPAPSVTEEAGPDEWEKISLDDMEPMEFLDTGAEISAPPKAKTPAPKAAEDDFSMDDEPLELADFDDESDLSDLPDLGDSSSDKIDSFDNDLDQDFLAPPALTEEPAPWNSEDSAEEEPVYSKPGKPEKAGKASKQEKAPKAVQAPANQGGGLDKVALLLSLSALSLLVLLILILLFLNMIKAPQPPVIQPEVQRWKESSTALESSRPSDAAQLDLGAAEPVTLEAGTILEVPSALQSARVSLVLEPGDSVQHAAARFGAPARVKGNELSW